MNRNYNTQPRRITVAEMSPHVHSFSYGENKVNKITKWMIEWIERSLKSGSIKPYDYLPSKSDLAFHIGVSLGTMQNVFRAVEDCGIVESKQRVGTYIAEKNNSNKIEKLTSKRELAVEAIKKFITDNKLKKGDVLASTRFLSEEIEQSPSTVRNALNTLMLENIIKKQGNVFLVNNVNFDVTHLSNQTLVEKISEKIKKKIEKDLETGKKLPSNPELAKTFNVSVKTIHDALKILAKSGLIISKRGQYGTVVANPNNENDLYYYEKIEGKIRHYIIDNAQIGSKLPSIKEFSEMFKVSSKTVKKALDMIFQDGYVTFVRGRYGGTFVTDIPKEHSEAYTWLALNPDYISNEGN